MLQLIKSRFKVGNVANTEQNERFKVQKSCQYREIRDSQVQNVANTRDRDIRYLGSKMLQVLEMPCTMFVLPKWVFFIHTIFVFFVGRLELFDLNSSLFDPRHEKGCGFSGRNALWGVVWLEWRRSFFAGNGDNVSLQTQNVLNGFFVFDVVAFLVIECSIGRQ